MAGGSGNTGLKWPDRFLPEAEAAEYHRRHNQTDHHFLDQTCCFLDSLDTLWPNDLVNRRHGSYLFFLCSCGSFASIEQVH